MEEIDVAIVGGGPAGLQAALVLARTRKRVVVFDSPEAPRNAASHGVHNFLGLDGLLPQQIRDQAWDQIDVYGTARLEPHVVTDIRRPDPSADFVVAAGEGVWRARHVLLACGYHDVYPEIDGFRECWGKTIIPCPFCDGYENRDRTWGIVPAWPQELDVFPSMVQNWTSERLVIAPPTVDVTPEQEAALVAAQAPLHRGEIVALTHSNGDLSGAALDSGETLEVGTLLWTLPERAAPLIGRLVEALGLKLDENGYVAADEAQRTNVDRLWAAGDVQGWAGAIEAATLGSMAATMIVREWYGNGDAHAS